MYRTQATTRRTIKKRPSPITGCNTSIRNRKHITIQLQDSRIAAGDIAQAGERTQNDAPERPNPTSERSEPAIGARSFVLVARDLVLEAGDQSLNGPVRTPEITECARQRRRER